MKKAHNIHIIIYIILILFLFKLILSYIINECFISGYNKDFVKYLSIANVYEPYVVHYNNGNRLYKAADYSGAIEEYEKALKLHPPEKKECSIRINLALAMIKNAESEKNPDIYDMLDVLHDAKEVLYEDGCANRDDDKGHSKKAEQLEDDIEEYEKLLKNQKDKSEDNDDDNGSEDDEQKKSELKRKEEQIKEQQKQNGKVRQEKTELSKDIKDYKYYNGKQW